MDADHLCRQAELAEQWGYESFFLPERHFVAELSIPDPLLLLAAISGRTDKIKLGTTSWLLPIRQPLLGAEQVAVLDQLCQGRLILGLGRGFDPRLFEAFDVESRHKRAHFDNCLRDMIAAWSGSPLGGSEPPIQLSPLPLQQPHPPLWIAAFGPRAIAQAGGLGLPYFASPRETVTQLQANLELFHQALAEADKPEPDQRPVMRVVFVSDNRQRCQAIASQLPGDASEASIIGSRAQVAAVLEEYRATTRMTQLIAVQPQLKGIEESWKMESLQLLRQII
jgi:alkanesulfonate monooxygenase SsuD/methylene tetrahydromethanopterin reductase-like flavin-dependent oxidoreductase (luciferase family)